MYYPINTFLELTTTMQGVERLLVVMKGEPFKTESPVLICDIWITYKKRDPFILTSINNCQFHVNVMVLVKYPVPEFTFMQHLYIL